MAQYIKNSSHSDSLSRIHSLLSNYMDAQSLRSKVNYSKRDVGSCFYQSYIHVLLHLERNGGKYA